MIFLELGNLTGIFIAVLLIMFGPPVILAIIGAAIKNKNKKASEIMYILAVVYLVIGLGVCGSMVG
ncbi:hypothetical protein P8625_09350 [Tenacibaculum tangerinum]|uniref:DUF4190 domain-containing protein n=1 Tax=Tenacibaculum tangerinum TaxID=3038772 RepID=A0ABY8KYK8_9FLAO|nr:hypothetical protein [Tenacibaculum tangerinum]WGH74321.1 hypothetical protein P8625_09350 [Tenacibaculum tangerinum]